MYCFLDIETTGLDPDEDQILEVAWAFVSEDPEDVTIYRPANFLIEQSDWQGTWSRLNSNEVVHKMHSESGLLAALANKDSYKVSIDTVYDELFNDLAHFSVEGLIHLAGRSVHFDKSFLIAESFNVLFDDSQPVSFHHRVLDLSSVKMALTGWGVDTQQFESANPEKAHRAMGDVMNDIAYFHNLNTYMKGALA